MSKQVGPVIMGHPVARAQLVTHGRVHSFRTSDRTTGETHYRTERTGTKEADVEIQKETTEIKPSLNNLQPHVEWSGFDSVKDWQAAIKEVHGSLVVPGYVYRITLDGVEL